MSNDMNFELELKKRFAGEAPELPESLKKENVIEMLENDNYVPKKKRHIFAKLMAAAAAFVVVVTSALVVPVILPEKGLIEAETTTTAPATTQEVTYKVIDNGFRATKLMKAESTDDLKNHFLKIYRENRLDDIVDGVFDFGFGMMKSENSADGAIAEDFLADGAQIGATMAPGATSAAVLTTAEAQNAGTPENAPEAPMPEPSADALTGSSGEDNYGKTNTQVENVDEADIIKNDGKYLYILACGAHKVDRRVTILDATNMSVASRIEFKSEDFYYNVQEMYVNGDRLVILASEYEKEEYDEDEEYYMYDSYGYRLSEGKIVSFLYDISDRSSPKLVRKVSQDGSEYISSRMIDGILYTVSQYVVRGDSESDVKENAVPEVNGKEISCDCIYIYDYDSKRYNILSAYDTKTDDGTVTSLSILGSGNEVYCSRDALYIAARGYNDDYSENYTEIYSFNLNGTDISYRASGTVKGDYLNQFSFDEYKENLRIATTYYSYKHDIDVSSIYVLNKDLQLIGQLEDIAYDEQVKSVRFMGDTGYIVTFRNTDPLFTLDLSDPTAPKIVGEVKLPGFSSYLHPVAEGLVVGLGYDGDEENADFNSVKVSLFDVSDLKKPVEVDSFVLKNVYSQALNNPKAFITYPEENLIGFPVEHYDSRTVLSYKLLKIENGEISNHLGYVHESERFTGDVFRGTYIGQKLYTVDNYNVCEFDIATAEMLRSCEILNVEDDTPDYYRDDENYGYYYGDYEITTPAVTPEEAATAKDSSTEVSIAMTTTFVELDSDSLAYATTAVSALSFEGKIIELNGNQLLVEVTDSGDSLISVGTQVSFSAIAESGYEKGDSVTVTFDGVVQETYPLIISNVLDIV